MAGQGGALAWAVLLLAFGIGAVGCSSIYHKTRNRLPPESSAELRLRIEETVRAERQTQQAAEKLARSLQRHEPLAILETDFDRLEAAAFDFERRALAARDVTEGCSEPSASAMEVDRLSREAESWLGFIATNRAADLTTQLRELQRMRR